MAELCRRNQSTSLPSTHRAPFAKGRAFLRRTISKDENVVRRRFGYGKKGRSSCLLVEAHSCWVLTERPPSRAADRRSANQSNRCGCFFLFRKHKSQLRFPPSPAQGTDAIVAVSPQGRLPRLIRADELGTRIRYARTSNYSHSYCHPHRAGEPG